MPRSRRTKQPPESSSTTVDDRAFRREQFLAALTDALYRLWLKQHGFDPAQGGV
jgi:hypothetical protein